MVGEKRYISDKQTPKTIQQDIQTYNSILVVPTSFDDGTDVVVVTEDVPRLPIESRGFILFVRDFLGLRLGRDDGKLLRFVYVVRCCGGKIVDFGDSSVDEAVAVCTCFCGCGRSGIGTAVDVTDAVVLVTGMCLDAAAAAVVEATLVLVTALI